MFTNIHEFRKAYEQALKDGLEVFEFDGDTVGTDYAEELLEYYEGPARA